MSMEPLDITQYQPVKSEPTIQALAVGGGKGGVGKSLFTTCLANLLGNMGKRVILMDADLGGANLNMMLGIRVPEATLDDFILRRVDSLDDILLETSLPNVRLIAGGSETPALANPNFGQKTRILRALLKLSADYLLVDLGAGSSLNTLDFFLSCPQRLLVMSAQPTSLQNAYSFVKVALYRRIGRILSKTTLRGMLDARPGINDEEIPLALDDILNEIYFRAPEGLTEVREAILELKIKLVLNMVHDPREAQIGQVLEKTCQQYLGLDVDVLGSIPYDPELVRWASRMNTSALASARKGIALPAIHDIACRIIAVSSKEVPGSEEQAA